MGGEVFDTTKSLTIDEYVEWINDFLKYTSLVEGIDYLFLYRLRNKTKHSDIDFIVNDCEKFINDISRFITIKESKKIVLSDEKINSYSMHLLTDDNIQIDVLKSWTNESMEMTRIFYAYSCANVFLKKLVLGSSDSFALSHLGLICFNNKYTIPDHVKSIRLDTTTRLITDYNYLFELINLDYKIFIESFDDEYELLKFIKTSKYYDGVKFVVNSKFRHNCRRLASFNNLYTNDLLSIA